jgi:hypothetical protein
MPNEDASLTRLIQREIGRRQIDATKLSVTASHGVVYLRGQVRLMRGHDMDLRQEMEIIKRILRSKQGVREVHMDEVIFR